LGNYVLTATDHLESGNRIQGVISPSGSPLPTEPSSYLNAAPTWWESSLAWPPFGDGTAGTIPAAQRYLAGGSVTRCPNWPCDAPNGLHEDSIAPTKALLAWNPVPEAMAYQLRGRKLGGGGWASLIVPGSKRLVPGLNEAESYAWQSRARCGTYWSSWSDTATFTTPASGFTLGEPFSTPGALRLAETWSFAPNPALGYVMVNTHADGTLRVIDAQGRIHAETPAVAGVHFRWNLEHLPAGWYVVEWRTAGLDPLRRLLLLQ
jgi:hypothetical protein